MSAAGSQGAPRHSGHGLRALAARLRAADVEVVWDDAFPGYHRCYAHDFFGNRLEFLEPDTAATAAATAAGPAPARPGRGPSSR